MGSSGAGAMFPFWNTPRVKEGEEWVLAGRYLGNGKDFGIDVCLVTDGLALTDVISSSLPCKGAC